jgi:hypothetical protein
MSASPSRLTAHIVGTVALFCFTSVGSFAQPALIDVESTPYDTQMARVQPVLAAMPAQVPGSISLTTVNQWMRQLRRLRYRYSSRWQTPEEVRAARCADCKGKAIALYQLMQSIGAANVCFVIGRHHAGDWFTHAWLQWETAKGTFILDPTFSGHVVRAEEHSSSKYIPLYVYEGMLRYRAVNAALISEKPLRAVAAGEQNQWSLSHQLWSDCRVR